MPGKYSNVQSREASLPLDKLTFQKEEKAMQTRVGETCSRWCQGDMTEREQQGQRRKSPVPQGQGRKSLLWQLSSPAAFPGAAQDGHHAGTGDWQGSRAPTQLKTSRDSRAGEEGTQTKTRKCLLMSS